MAKQNLIILIPDSDNIFSNFGTSSKNCSYFSLDTNHITGSTQHLLYHDLSKNTISQPAGKCCIYLWKYHWVFSTSLGFTKATTLAPLGFKCSVILFIVPPLPAASLPSNINNTFKPFSLT